MKQRPHESDIRVGPAQAGQRPYHSNLRKHEDALPRFARRGLDTWREIRGAFTAPPATGARGRNRMMGSWVWRS